MTGRVRVGISGWRYPAWRRAFYPPGLAQRYELAYASRIFGAIEINATFYSLQRAGYFRRWRAETPGDFVFAIKGGRFITHMKKLKEVEGALANFFASGPLELGRKLGPILWQLPPNFRFDAPRLQHFFDLLPRDQASAVRLAAGHDRRVVEPGWEGVELRVPVRHALEIRHASFGNEEFIELLRRNAVTLVVADGVTWPLMEDVTADLVYLRLHGSEELYTSGYDDAALDHWAARVRAWAAGGEPEGAAKTSAARPPRKPRDVFAFFDNDAKVRAPSDALGLMRRLGLGAE